MITQIPLSVLAKQTLNITIDAVAYALAVSVQPDGTMLASITRNGELLVSNARCFSSYPILRYRYLQGTFGNFFWDTPNDELPNWQKFGVSHFLYHLSDDEIAPA